MENIYNGCDAKNMPAPESKEGGGFRFYLYRGLSRDLASLSPWDGIKALLPKYPRLRLRFMKNVCEELRGAAAERGWGCIVRYDPCVPHRKSWKALAGKGWSDHSSRPMMFSILTVALMAATVWSGSRPLVLYSRWRSFQVMTVSTRASVLPPGGMDTT